MIRNLTPPIRAAILDMDGVLWKGTQPLADLPAVFARMAAQQIKVMAATNNTTRSTHDWVEKLAGFGVSVSEEQVINSAQATARYLEREYPGGAQVYIVGERGLIETLAASGFENSENHVAAVVAGLDREVTYEKLKRATLLVGAGARLIGTNPDLTLPTPEGEIPGAGTIIAALEASTGQRAVVIGKPAPAMFEIALERLGTQPQETLVVGDRIETDIAGGQAAGCRTALVLSGVATLEQARAWSPAPDFIAENIAELF